MNDAFLHALRRDPSPEFKDQLRRRLRADDAAVFAPAASRRPLVWAAAAAVVVLSALLTVPGVRASASQFLSLFRVVNFVAVPVESSNLDRLDAKELEIGKLIGEHVQVLKDPGAPVPAISFEAAAAASGMTLAVPQWLPANSSVIETSVMGERVLQITASATRLQQVMDALGIGDLTAPAALEGQTVNVRVPPIVMVRYDHGDNRRSRLFQARAPQVTLPESVNMAALGEIGLRILGLEAAEAKRFAQTIDWNTTMLVPIPPAVSSFRQVTIGGRPAIMFEHQPESQAPTRVILWAASDRIFALVSISNQEEAIAMANSVR